MTGQARECGTIGQLLERVSKCNYTIQYIRRAVFMAAGSAMKNSLNTTKLLLFTITLGYDILMALTLHLWFVVVEAVVLLEESQKLRRWPIIR